MKDDSEIVNSYAKGFLLGAIIGGAVGAITALLFAPKPGKELREELSYRSKDLIEKDLNASTTDKVPSALSLRPVNGKLSGPL